jgi:hypothetical protein
LAAICHKHIEPPDVSGDVKGGLRCNLPLALGALTWKIARMPDVDFETDVNAGGRSGAMKKKLKLILKWIVGALVVVFALLQFTNPPRTNPPVVNDLMATSTPPPPVAAMLHAACYDCHSHETTWPWYSRVAPMSWLIANDVNDGRDALNLSDWPAAKPDRAAKRLEDMSEEIGYEEMPPKKYTAIHVNARLTDAQRKELTDWLDAEAARLKATVTN